VNILHHHLEAVETACLRNLDLGRETLSEVLEHDAITRRKEGKYIFDEMLFVLLKILPVFLILR